MLVVMLLCASIGNELLPQTENVEASTKKNVTPPTPIIEIKTNLPILAVNEEAVIDTLPTKLQDNWEKIAKKYKRNLSIAVYDRQSGNTYSYQTREEGFITASIAKVAVLAQLLHNSEHEKRSLKKDELAMTQAMITQSDNGSTHYLVDHQLGGVKNMAQLYTELEMSDTQIDEESWGLTETTATDQVKLLNMIYSEDDYLNASSKQYIKDLMGKVKSDQHWGISATSSEVELKNGWLSVDGSTTWHVNSIGHVTLSKNQTYDIAILTADNPSYEKGISFIEETARSTYQLIQNNPENEAS